VFVVAVSSLLGEESICLIISCLLWSWTFAFHTYPTSRSLEHTGDSHCQKEMLMKISCTVSNLCDIESGRNEKATLNFFSTVIDFILQN
jgi:hypothetical protein